MPFTLFVLRVLPMNDHCKVSIGVYFINSKSVLSSLHLDFPSVTGRVKGGKTCVISEKPRANVEESIYIGHYSFYTVHK